MNGYKAFWKDKECEVYVDTSYAAQTQAVVEFQKMAGRRKVKSYDVTVVICEKNDSLITHTFSE
jgi:hypothetical protein